MLATIEFEEIDGGLGQARREPARLCLATREVLPVEQMVRFVVGPDGRVVPDLERKLPGRGAWVRATRTALERAIRENAFARAFRGKGVTDAELGHLVDRALESAALSALSLANKAGQVITGFAKIEAALREKEIAVVLNACDAAVDGVRKLDGAARSAAAAGRPEPTRISPFRGEQLDLALGRPNVVHAALPVHPASAGFLARCQRLESWRTGGPDGDRAVSGRRAD